MERGGTRAQQSNLSSEKLLILLEHLSMQEAPCRLQELALATQMPPSTLLRFLRVLQNRGYVLQDPMSGRYALSLKLCGLADRIRSHHQLTHNSAPFLRQVVNLFQESANMAVENAGWVIYIDIMHHPARTLLSYKHIGSIAPLHCTGVGKLLLLNYDQDGLDAYIHNHGLTWYTEHTITSREGLLAELARIRGQGYAYDNEECEIGVRCIAAPVYDNDGKVLAGISATGPTIRMTTAYIRQRLPAFLAIADAFSLTL